MKENHKYPGLEVIRALAALTVLYNHIFTFRLIPGNVLLWMPGQYATEAVIIFFVLSGVVITLSAERKKTQYKSHARLLISYLKARFLRIYPIFIVGLLLAAIAERNIDGTWMSAKQVFGNVFLLQSLHGYVVSGPRYNLPLWSLSYEMSYYILFGLCLLFKRFIIIWTSVAFLTASLLYPPSATGGATSQLISVSALSLSWIMGHAIARWREDLPRVPVSFGIACLMIGCAYARCPLTTEYLDAFRLTSFAVCACPLMLAIIAKDNQSTISVYTLNIVRIALGAIGIILLWVVSPSLLPVKTILTATSTFAATVPLIYIDRSLRCLRCLAPGLVYIGSISYAIYAVHTPIIALLAHFGHEWGIAIKIALFGTAILAIAHVMERVVQPALSRRSPAAARQLT